jgi:hypothetical protein
MLQPKEMFLYSLQKHIDINEPHHKPHIFLPSTWLGLMNA